MAKVQGVWGIDIGQCSLKALRCLPGEGSQSIIADAFDYIEYPKILSQPEADAEQLVDDALRQFLSRNDVRGDRVAVSVPGQNGLQRFVKLPPVEVKKIPDLVKYEARNQIPFDLDDVIWDYQQMGGGMIEEGFALDIEVGLFAMKREQVAKILKPFDNVDIEVDIVQLTPLALYNFITFDELQNTLPDSDLYDAENPPDSVVLISLGTDTTDLVITDGFRVWQRSIPVGGSHFTKALTKELKQTFAKAEHVKRNAAQAENPKALFQAMRPVFADLVTEVQRSLNFFSNIHKKAKVVRGIALGNTAKLPGLVRFLSQNLKLPIQRADSFSRLEGAGIVDAPTFQENVLAFPVCYGLCIQGLVADTAIKTNLIPPEILTDRLIRSKKPWVAGAIAALSVALSISFFGYWKACQSVREEPFKRVESNVQQWLAACNAEKQKFDAQAEAFKASDQTLIHLKFNYQRHVRWLKLFKAIDVCLPHDDKVLEEIARRNVLYITSITSEKRELAGWQREISAEGKTDGGNEGDLNEPPAVQLGGESADEVTGGLSGTGYVITIRGYHYHNIRLERFEQGKAYLQRTLIRNLKLANILVGPPGKQISIPIQDLGIRKPTVVSKDLPGFNENEKEDNPFFDKEKKTDPEKNPMKLVRYNFVVQFAWLDTEAMKQEQQQDQNAGDDRFAANNP